MIAFCWIDRELLWVKRLLVNFCLFVMNRHFRCERSSLLFAINTLVEPLFIYFVFIGYLISFFTEVRELLIYGFVLSTVCHFLKLGESNRAVGANEWPYDHIAECERTPLYYCERFVLCSMSGEPETPRECVLRCWLGRKDPARFIAA